MESDERALQVVVTQIRQMMEAEGYVLVPGDYAVEKDQHGESHYLRYQNAHGTIVTVAVSI